ncbi:MAG: AAA family ATPase [Patescibacteria group bacterium]|nr:AAA family ATPase [Patescibacteria group bacterium]
MNENKIIAAFVRSRKAWESAKDAVTEGAMSPVASLLLKLIGEYYGNDRKADRCDVDILASRVEREVQSNKLAQAVVEALKRLPEDVSSINVARELSALRKDSIGKKLASLLAAGRGGSEVSDLIEQYKAAGSGEPTASEAGVDVLVGPPVKELVEKSFNKEGLIQLWPKVLNDQIGGGCRPGHHILVFAPTEMGKTLFVVNAVAGFLKQGLTCLYIGNEDPAADLLMRIINRLTGMNKQEVQDAPAKAQSILDKRNYDKLIMAPLAPGNFRQVDKLVEQYGANVVVLDQLRNMDVDSENRTQALEKAATEGRNLGKRRNALVMSVTQAADSASGKTILRRGDVDGSNVGIPGQIDLMIGMGATEEMEQQNQRVLSFPKNKLSGIHTPIPIFIDPLLSKVVEDA